MDPKEVISEEESQAIREADVAVAEETGDVPTREGEIRDLHADHWERIVADEVPALSDQNRIGRNNSEIAAQRKSVGCHNAVFQRQPFGDRSSANK